MIFADTYNSHEETRIKPTDRNCVKGEGDQSRPPSAGTPLFTSGRHLRWTAPAALNAAALWGHVFITNMNAHGSAQRAR
jgi:hypothetical protein